MFFSLPLSPLSARTYHSCTRLAHDGLPLASYITYQSLAGPENHADVRVATAASSASAVSGPTTFASPANAFCLRHYRNRLKRDGRKRRWQCAMTRSVLSGSGTREGRGPPAPLLLSQPRPPGISSTSSRHGFFRSSMR